MPRTAPSIVADGTQVYGTFVITVVGVGAGTFTIEELRVQRPQTEAKDQTYQGKPNRYRSTDDVFKWTGNLQIAVPPTTQLYPAHGDYFQVQVDPNYGTETFVFNAPEQDLSNQAAQIRKLPVSGWICLNGTGSLTTVI